MTKWIAIVALISFFLSCNTEKSRKEVQKQEDVPFYWENATVYFLLTDRFNNGDSSNDVNFNRSKETAVLRGFEGGDIKGITAKIKDGYFNELGVNAIWFTPVVEQVHGSVDEGTGNTYGFHGYWAKDWTALDPNYGTMDHLKELVETAHQNNIRIVLDGVINHTGPVTDKDPVWPDNWVRTAPQCTYTDYESTVTCTLVKNLPDIRTESEEEVGIPEVLAEKWKNEGRYEQEMAELDAFFERTGYPRLPKYYIIKWLTDYIYDFGIDGYRADTVKHIEESVWQDFRVECDYAFNLWKTDNPDKILDDNDFYLVGEVYNYGISGGEYFDFGDKKVNYYENAFHSLINFEFKWDARESHEFIFSKYAGLLKNELKDYSVMNYLSSHDDGSPFDQLRDKPYESATKLLLSPGSSQIYYGDESARLLKVEGANGDANLRSFMNWDAVEHDDKTQKILEHWQKLGKFRQLHPSVGAGEHQMISESPYVFKRSFKDGAFEDEVFVGIDLPIGEKVIDLNSSEYEGKVLKDFYSGQESIVKNGTITFETAYNIVLISR